MSVPHRPRLEGQPPPATGPRAARPAAPETAVGDPKDAARKGVLSALRPDPHRFRERCRPGEDPTPERPGIRIYAPPVYRHHWDGARWSTRPGDTPTAAYACACGHTDTARGQDAVAALVTEYAAHQHFCTGTPAVPTEGRAAA
ncbi:hypothetical protein ACFOOM_04390 [Streptomyces echinoruber]|uniref:Uncharacterized protein n=1 Tax=Streptomyces echinoruber TaxID=68898 RepID=A0A918VPY1_9ACTN|nr:hypothetical protein [Streptomyces echinoruber]GHA13136.1 hypothetical protein GCM10010389_60080 [Streptomyces echinoruber]